MEDLRFSMYRSQSIALSLTWGTLLGRRLIRKSIFEKCVFCLISGRFWIPRYQESPSFVLLFICFAKAGPAKHIICRKLQMKKRVPAFGFWGLCHNNTTRFLQLQGLDRIFVEFLQKNLWEAQKKPPLEGEPRGSVLPEILRIRQRPLSQHP